MSIGMTIDEFWNGTPRLLEIYVRANEEKQKAMDMQMWAMGRYVFIGTYVAVGRLFGGKNFTTKYPDVPFSASQKTKEEMDEEEAERAMRKMIAAEEAWIANAKLRGLK